MKILKIKFHYNDIDIEINGKNFYKNKDENGPEIDGEIGMRWIEEIVNIDELEEMQQKAKDLGFTDENFYEVKLDKKHYLIPLKEQKEMEKEVKEDMYYYAKDKYFDLYLLGQHILAEKEIPQKIKNMKKGTTFTFSQFFKEYTIVDQQEQFEIYSKIIGQVLNLIQIDEKSYYEKQVYAYEKNLDTYDLPQQVAYVRT